MKAVAGSAQYDKFTKWKLKKILELKYKNFDNKTISSLIEGESLLEMMAGYGRHVPTYQKWNPKSICLVDFNELAIKKARELYPDIEAYA